MIDSGTTYLRTLIDIRDVMHAKVVEKINEALYFCQWLLELISECGQTRQTDEVSLGCSRGGAPVLEVWRRSPLKLKRFH